MIGDITDIIIVMFAFINTTIASITFWRVSQVQNQTNSMHHEIVALTRSDAKKNGVIEEMQKQVEK